MSHIKIMATQLIVYAWHTVFGTVNVEKMKSSFFLPQGFELYTEVVNYPNGAFSAAKKTLTTDQGYDLELDVRISTRGYLIWRIYIDLDDDNLIRFEDYKISISEYDLKDKTVYDLMVQLIYQFFDGQSLMELYSGNLMRSEKYLEMLNVRGITEYHDQSHFNMAHYYLTESEQVFTELEGLLEMEKIHPVNGAFIPNKEPVEIPSINARIKFGENIILLNKQKNPLVKQIHEGMNHYKIGTMLLSQIYSNIDNQLYKLINYLNSSEDTSWLYVQSSIQELEIRYQKLKHEFERGLSSYLNFNGTNYEDTDFITRISFYYELPQSNEELQEIKTEVVEKFHMIERLLSDKGEKEEQEATNNLIQIIGILAIFEVISEFLPVLPERVLFSFRIGFLFIVFPLLIWVWYRSQWKNSKKQKRAETLKKQKDLESLYEGMRYFKGQLERQVDSLGPDILEDMFTAEIEKINSTIQDLEQKLKITSKESS